MERNYDEVISNMLIQLDQIDRRMKKAEERMEKFDVKLEKSNKRMDLTIKRMVMAEKKLVDQSKINENFLKRLEQSEKLLIRTLIKNNLKI
jgi:hypothetical protein